MSKMDPVTQEIAAAQPLLLTVRTYLDLITRSDQLVYGEGLKRLYVMATGLASFNDEDIEAIVAKAESQGLLPYSLQGFMVQRIVRNCELYGQLLAEQIRNRLMEIARGDVPQPRSRVGYNPVAARWFYYLPPQTLVARIQKALRQGGYNYGEGHQSVSLVEVATEAELALANTAAREGHMVPQAAAYSALAAVVDQLTGLLSAEACYPIDQLDYKKHARPALVILLVIAKFLAGDLQKNPLPHELSRVDLNDTLSFSDGTLAALPFPTRPTIGLFSDGEYGRGITLKARAYLNAVSTATLCRTAL